ncbi:MAG: lytic transglycosylase domain-containing protein [Pseudomonadota bacterium]
MVKTMCMALFGAAIAVGLPGLAGEADFTFKRVSPPPPGAKRLITIHVDPVAAPERVLDRVLEIGDGPPPERETASVGATSETADWFWRRLSPALSDKRLGRLAEASRVLAAGPKAEGGPSSQMLRRIVERHGPAILAATAGTEVSPALVAAVIAVESGGRVDAVSPAGARGLMQLMPATAARFGVTKPFEPAESLKGGVAYLSFLLDRFDGDAVLTLAAYNAGEGAVERAGGVPDYPETRAYVPKVVAAWGVARGLCRRPPVRVSDACLFETIRLAAD